MGRSGDPEATPTKSSGPTATGVGDDTKGSGGSKIGSIVGGQSPSRISFPSSCSSVLRLDHYYRCNRWDRCARHRRGHYIFRSTSSQQRQRSSTGGQQIPGHGYSFRSRHDAKPTQAQSVGFGRSSATTVRAVRESFFRCRFLGGVVTVGLLRCWWFSCVIQDPNDPSTFPPPLAPHQRIQAQVQPPVTYVTPMGGGR